MINLEPEVGNFYWMRQKFEKIWRVCYFAQDPDNNMWIEVLGVASPQEVALMNLSFFEFVKIEKPSEALMQAAEVIVDQPEPKVNDEWPVWGMVMEDMRKRDFEGRAKYGVALQPFNGRDALVDAYQEALDLSVYLRQFIFEETGK